MRDSYTGQEYAEERRLERAREQWLAGRPCCSNCGEPLEEEYAWRIDNKYYCDECAEELFREYIG